MLPTSKGGSLHVSPTPPVSSAGPDPEVYASFGRNVTFATQLYVFSGGRENQEVILFS